MARVWSGWIVGHSNLLQHTRLSFPKLPQVFHLRPDNFSQVILMKTGLNLKMLQPHKLILNCTLFAILASCSSQMVVPKIQHDSKPITETQPVISPQPEVGTKPVGTPDEYADVDDPIQDAILEIPVSDAASSWVGAREIQTPRIGSSADSIALDTNENVVAAGTFDRSLHRDVHHGSGRIWESEGAGADVFVQKFSKDGQLLWKREFGGSNFEILTGLALGPNNEIYIAGRSGSSNLRGLETKHLEQGFLTAYSSGGKRLWTRRPGLTVSALTVNPLGDVFVTGASCLTKLSAYSPERSNKPCSFFVTKYDKSGNRWWTTVPEPRDPDSFSRLESHDIAVDHKNHVFVVGSTNAPLLGVQNTGFDGFILKLQADGVVKEPVFLIGDSGASVISQIRINAEDDLVVSGATSSQFLFGLQSKMVSLAVEIRRKFLQSQNVNPELIESQSQCPDGYAPYFPGCNDSFFVKLDSKFDRIWTRFVQNDLNFTSTQTDQSNLSTWAVPGQRFFLEGDGSIDYLLSRRTYIYPNGADNISFQDQLVRFTTDGKILNSKPFATSNIKILNDITVSNLGKLFVAANRSDPTIVDQKSGGPGPYGGGSSSEIIFQKSHGLILGFNTELHMY